MIKVGLHRVIIQTAFKWIIIYSNQKSFQWIIFIPNNFGIRNSDFHLYKQFHNLKSIYHINYLMHMLDVDAARVKWDSHCEKEVRSQSFSLVEVHTLFDPNVWWMSIFASAAARISTNFVSRISNSPISSQTPRRFILSCNELMSTSRSFTLRIKSSASS